MYRCAYNFNFATEPNTLRVIDQNVNPEYYKDQKQEEQQEQKRNRGIQR
ncbi:hypothetical protein FH171_11665 [Staphylococcus haemolyticus]|nr:hypothetical protein [Staphylococcus haemolyticus]